MPGFFQVQMTATYWGIVATHVGIFFLRLTAIQILSVREGTTRPTQGLGS